MRPVGIGETLRYAITKFLIRAAGDQAKTACGSLQLCAIIESGIEGVTHTVAQRRRERTVPAPEERSDDDSKEGSTAEEDIKGRSGLYWQKWEVWEK